MGSTRFPGKVLEILDGTNPSLQFTINQLKESKFLQKIVIATTKNSEDDQIVSFAENLELIFFEVILITYYHDIMSVPNFFLLDQFCV